MALQRHVQVCAASRAVNGVHRRELQHFPCFLRRVSGGVFDGVRGAAAAFIDTAVYPFFHTGCRHTGGRSAR